MRKRIEIIALLLCTVLVLSACGSREQVIVPVPLEEARLAEASYQSPGYYAPNALLDDEIPIAPAPATLEEIYAAAAAAAQRLNAAPASDYAPNIPKGDINVGLVMGEQFDINPVRCNYQEMMNLSTQVFEGLVALDEYRMPVPQLADRWDVSGTNWEFTLRTGIQFHNGAYLTPEDVVASYEEIKRNPKSYWYPALTHIKSMRMINENTVGVTSATKGYMTLYALTFPVMQRDSINARIPIGTGPYLISDYSEGNAIRLELSPVWWKHASDRIKSIVGLVYRSSQDAIAAMEAMEIDTIATEYPTASIGRNLSDRITLDYSTSTYECIVPNLRSPILQDHAVREALMHAIDRNTLAQTIYTNMVQESEVPVVPGSGLYERQAARYTYNPERALKILNDAGWVLDEASGNLLVKQIDGKPTHFRIQLFTADRGTTSTRSEACETIKDQLRRIGIEVTIKSMSHTALDTAMKERKFDLALCAFELGDFPNLYFLLHSQGDCNYAGYNSGEMDQMLRAAYDASTEEELILNMSMIQMKCINDLPILGLFFRNGLLSSRASLDGIVSPRRGYVFGQIAAAMPGT